VKIGSLRQTKATPVTYQKQAQFLFSDKHTTRPI